MKPVRILAALLMLATIVLTFSACQDIASPLEDYKWVLTNYSSDGGMKAMLPDTEISAFFDSKEKTVTGSGGVNYYSGKYAADHLTLKITEMTLTLMSGGPEKDAQEKAFMNILGNATRFELDHGNLTIFSGNSRIIFKNTNSKVKPPTKWGQ